METKEQVESYKSLSEFEKKNFISELIDLLLYSSYFYVELKEFVNDYKKKKGMQEVRRSTVPVFSGDVSTLLPNREKVQPKEDYTKTAQYKAEREIKGVLPFEGRLLSFSPSMRSAINRMRQHWN